MNNTRTLCVFTERFPSEVGATLCLLRKRLGLSRELSDDVVRSRGHVRKMFRKHNDIYEESSVFDDMIHGQLYRYWRNGSYKAQYKEDVKHGYTREWHANGTLSEVLLFINGLEQGLSQCWSADGTLHGECTYVDGQLHGWSRSWYTHTGEVRHKVLYVHGQRVSNKQEVKLA